MRKLLFLLSLIIVSPLCAETVFIDATQDNTLYESVAGEISNGAGEHFLVGRTGAGELRRGLIAFKDLGAIPAGATIKRVKLHLRLSRENSPETTIHLLPAQSNWGEGASDAPGEEGQGAPSQTGDATWLHRFYDTQTWTNPGGDFPEVPSGSFNVDDVGSYIFGSTNGMVADVQDWLDNPGENFGWFMIGDETANSSKRFDSRNHSDSAYHPVLEVEFSATGSIFDFSGLWFDPTLDGEGYIVYKTPYGWLVYFFGYSADGEFMWLVSELVTLDQLFFGTPFELPMLIGKPGTFSMPTPSSELTPWGTLNITFFGCTTGLFELDGVDGKKTSDAVKLIGVEDTNCLEI